MIRTAARSNINLLTVLRPLKIFQQMSSKFANTYVFHTDSSIQVMYNLFIQI